MRKRHQVAIISVVCVGIYVGLRSLPVEQCEFLHYGDFINADGVLEGCGYEETTFFSMQDLGFSIIAELTPLSELRAGEPADFKLTLFTTTGRPIRWDEIAVSHTERVHALVVDSSLQDYQHLHPVPAGPPGHYRMQMVPRHGGDYRVYLDFIALTNSRRILLEAGFEVEGAAVAAVPAHKISHTAGELEFSMVLDGALVAGSEQRCHIAVKHRDGDELVFSTVMDAYAHMVAFDEHGTGFAHLHPLNPFTEGQDPSQPDLEFAFYFDQPGYYRFWAQMIINGTEYFVPFDVMVQSPALALR
jgi:hypothetical protein